MSLGKGILSVMRVIRSVGLYLGCLICAGVLTQADAPLPPYGELLELIRNHGSGLPENELESAAAGALLAKVRGRVLLPGETAEPLSEEPAIVRREIYDGCAYVQVGQVTRALAPELAAAMRQGEFAESRGLILDLRFAVGDDYLAAANVVSLFLTGETKVLSWGDREGLSTVKTNAWTRPVAVLVNRDTRGGAEALAAALRQQRLALVIGGRTAGAGAVFKEVPLADGSGNRLRLAVATVKTADGQVLPAEGVEPDIQVNVRPEHDRAYLADPFSIVLASGPSRAGGTNIITSVVTVVRKRVSEADLVRQKRELAIDSAGRERPAADSTQSPESNGQPATAELAKVVKDPVLGRALDLLKGLSLLGAQRP